MASKDVGTPLVTPRTCSLHSYSATPRSASGSRLTTPRDENPSAPRADFLRSSLSALPPRPATLAAAPPSAVFAPAAQVQQQRSTPVYAGGGDQEITSAASCGAAQLFGEQRIGEEAVSSSAAAVLLIALSALQQQEACGLGNADSSTNEHESQQVLIAALTMACRHIQRFHGPIADWFVSTSAAAATGAGGQVHVSCDAFPALLTELGVAHVVSRAEALQAFLAVDMDSKGQIDGQQLGLSLRSPAVLYTAHLLMQPSDQQLLASTSADKRSQRQTGKHICHHPQSPKNYPLLNLWCICINEPCQAHSSVVEYLNKDIHA